MRKQLCVLILAATTIFVAHAQNVGIGTTTPNYPLSFPNTLGDKISLWGTSGNHYGIGVQSLTLQLHTDISTADIAFGYGTSASFTENMRIKGNGNVGIGIINPASKLHIFLGASGYSGSYFPGMLLEGNNNSYINLLTPNVNETGLLFGTSNNLASGGILYNNVGNPNGLQFRTNGNVTRMIIDNAGRVGMGASPSISDGILDVNGRMRIRSGGDIFHTAGTWLNNVNNSSLAAFIGMNDDDAHVGFYGSGNGWGFAMNTNTGALQVNGSEGSPGQAIVSNGSGAAPSWSSISNWLFNNISEVNQTSSAVDIPHNFTFITIPTMDVTDFSVTVNSPTKLLLCLSVTANTNGCFGCGGTDFSVGSYVYKNGSAIANQVLLEGPIGNGEVITMTSGFQMISVSPGTYTFKTQAINNGGPDVFISFGKLLVVTISQ